MNQNTINSLFELRDRRNADSGKIESFIVDNHASPEEITVTTIRLANKHIYEIGLYDYPDMPLPSPDERITTGWVEPFELLLKLLMRIPKMNRHLSCQNRGFGYRTMSYLK